MLLQRNKAVNNIRVVLKVTAVLIWSLHFLRAFSIACGFEITGLNLEEQIYAKLYPCLKVFFDIISGSGDEDWISFIARCEVYYSKESSRTSRLLCPAERDKVFLQGKEPDTIAAMFGIF